MACEGSAVLQMLVAGWQALGMLSRGEFVGIMGFTSMDWLVSDIATTYVGGIMAPLPTNILVEDIKQLILEAEVRSVWGTFESTCVTAYRPAASASLTACTGNA